ncbi:MAG: outer membrane beta-barrel protein [Acidobacteriota bacterium]
MKRLILAPLLAAAAFAQGVGIGLKAGAPATDVVKKESWQGGRYQPASGRYVIGPMFELRLPFRLGVEVDALYRTVKYRAHMASVSSEASGNAWQFPVLLKYRFSDGASPYIGAGFVFNRLTGLKELKELTDASSDGVVGALGVEVGGPVLRIAPEVRYTRWRTSNLRSLLGGFDLSNRHQLEVLVGVTF